MKKKCGECGKESEATLPERLMSLPAAASLDVDMSQTRGMTTRLRFGYPYFFEVVIEDEVRQSEEEIMENVIRGANAKADFLEQELEARLQFLRELTIEERPA